MGGCGEPGKTTPGGRAISLASWQECSFALCLLGDPQSNVCTLRLRGEGRGQDSEAGVRVMALQSLPPTSTREYLGAVATVRPVPWRLQDSKADSCQGDPVLMVIEMRTPTGQEERGSQAPLKGGLVEPEIRL